MRVDLASLALGFGIGYLALTESGRKQAIKISNQGGEILKKLADKYVGEPISKVLGGVENVATEKVADGTDKEEKLD